MQGDWPGSSEGLMYRAALESLGMPLLIHDRDTILFANAATRSFLKAEESNLCGRCISDFVHPDAAEAGTVRRSLVLDNGQRLTELPVKLRGLDGSTLYTTVSAGRIAWDGGAAVMIFVDGSIADARIESPPGDGPRRTDVFAAALDALPHPVVVYDDEVVLFANPAAEQVMGVEWPMSLAGTPVKTLTLPDLADIHDVRRAYVIEKGVALSDVVIKLKRLDGTSRTVCVDIQPLSFGSLSAAMATLSLG